MVFLSGKGKNILRVYYKYIMLQKRIFADLVHWEILKNWKENVANSCTVHGVVMILKSMFLYFKFKSPF